MVSRRRRLSDEEEALWTGVARSITPLRQTKTRPKPPDHASAVVAPAAVSKPRPVRGVTPGAERPETHRRRWRRSIAASNSALQAAERQSMRGSIFTASRKRTRMRRFCVSCGARRRLAPRSSLSSPERARYDGRRGAAIMPKAASRACSGAKSLCGFRSRSFGRWSSVWKMPTLRTAARERFTCGYGASGNPALTLPIAKADLAPFYWRKKVFFDGNNCRHVGDQSERHPVNAQGDPFVGPRRNARSAGAGPSRTVDEYHPRAGSRAAGTDHHSFRQSVA